MIKLFVIKTIIDVRFFEISRQSTVEQILRWYMSNVTRTKENKLQRCYSVRKET